MDAGEPSSSGWSISDLTLPFASLTKLREYMINLECVRDSVNDVMINSNMKDDWKDTVRTFDRIVDIDWRNCVRMQDGSAKEKYTELD